MADHPFATIKAIGDQPRSVVHQILLPKPGEESCEPTLDLFFGVRFQQARAVARGGGGVTHLMAGGQGATQRTGWAGEEAGR